MDLNTLPPDERCWALVGKFMQGWALTEFVLHKAIAKALGLTTDQALIVGVNMAFAQKIFLCRTALNMSSVDAAQIKHFDTVLKQIARFSETRNAIAHNVFMPMEHGTGVSFFVFKAQGKFKAPDMNWSIEDFDAADQDMIRFRSELYDLEAKLETSALVRSLMKSPTNRPRGLGGMFGWTGEALPTLGDLLAPEPERRSDQADQ